MREIQRWGLLCLVEDIAAWKANAAHQIAQQRGKEEWYSRYSLSVCKVERDYVFEM